MQLRLQPILFVLIFVTIFSCGTSNRENQTAESLDYKTEIAQHRSEKDAMFKSDEESPLSERDRASFEGLKYFPIDETYKVEARLSRFIVKETTFIPTSTGEDRMYNQYGFVKFELNGKTHRMLVLQPTEEGLEDYFFLPFADETSAEETYGGGRYLDVEVIDKQNTVLLDFNLAYNPYCAYSDKYSCPIPPEENFLHTKIEAGEMVFSEH